MNSKIRIRLVHVVVCMVSGGLLSACGTAKVALPSSALIPSPQSSSATTSRSDFAVVVNQAMSHVSLTNGPQLMAPTMLPQDQFLGSGVSGTHSTVMTTPTRGYAVQLLSGSSVLTTYGAKAYPTIGTAAAAVETNATAVNAGTRQKVEKVHLGSHVTASVSQFGTSDSSISAVAITWPQSQWHITVTNTSGSAVPTVVAKELVSDFEGATLPNPDVQGSIFVNLAESSGVSVDVQWQKGVDEYFVDVTDAATNPLNAAIQIAASMTRYP